MFSFRRKEGFEFSHSPEHTFTSGVIYCLKDETFLMLPPVISSLAKSYHQTLQHVFSMVLSIFIKNEVSFSLVKKCI